MTRINDRIRAPKVRVVLANGDQLGVMTARDALTKAQSLGLDLVEIAGQADPPVCKIIEDLKTMAQVDQPPKLNGRAVAMILSPLPQHQRKRKFQLFHGELMDEDDFEEDDHQEEEDFDDIPDEASGEPAAGTSADAAAVAEVPETEGAKN